MIWLGILERPRSVDSDLDAQTTQEALEMILNHQVLLDAKSTVIYQSNWHKGVIGIVASRLIESYYRPTVVLTKSNGLITGSFLYALVSGKFHGTIDPTTPIGSRN